MNNDPDKTDITKKAHCFIEELDVYGRSGKLGVTLFAIDKITFLEYMVALEKSGIVVLLKCYT